MEHMTLAEFAQRLKPDWAFLNDWLTWPPDVFAFTSMVFQRTGCYRFIVSKDWHPVTNWQQEADHAARNWLVNISSMLAGEFVVPADETVARASVVLGTDLGAGLIAEIMELSNSVTLNDLRMLFEVPPGSNGKSETKQLCAALIKLHAIADVACKGFGLLSSSNRENAMAHCFANLLLTTTGSLASFPKHDGVVLPKMRTPQSGLTVRSFSHYVTYHCSEVEVIWRTMPWPNIEENMVNILAVPWPFRIDENSFRPSNETFQWVRYFKYDSPDAVLGLQQIIELIKKVKRKGVRVHVLAFPEVSLSSAEFEKLMVKLRVEYLKNGIDHVPMIIAGVRDHEQSSVTDASEDEHSRLNEVRLSAYFASRWYVVAQQKHHRWKLNRDQIRQYGLQGKLATTRGWFEDIAISQRRLTFLAPTGWLTLCSLICEDLAQLEPVSELIRGVGPNLLVALLLDGPQLENRWAARYANVLADDPGTGVLSLTSSGMVARSSDILARSIQPHENATSTSKPETSPKHVVALWRDQVEKWKKISLDTPSQAVLLTLSASWIEEFTADGRSNDQSASLFKYEGHELHCLCPKKTPDEVNDVSPNQPEGHIPDDPTATEPETRPPDFIAEWEDIRELTAATFALDAMLESHSDPQRRKRIISWIEAVPDGYDVEPSRQIADLISLLQSSLNNPAVAGVVADTPSERPKVLDLTGFAKLLIDGLPVKGTNQTVRYWKELQTWATDRLESLTEESEGHHEEQRRGTYLLALAVLSALHLRVENQRRLSQIHHPDDIISSEEARKFLISIEASLRGAPRLRFLDRQDR